MGFGFVEDAFDKVGGAINKGLEETIDLGTSIIDGTITQGGLATGTVIEGLVEGGAEVAQSATEVGSNILGNVGKSLGMGLDQIAGTLGIPGPTQVAGGFNQMLLLGGLAIVALLIFSRRSGPGTAPPQIVMLPGGQLANVAV